MIVVASNSLLNPVVYYTRMTRFRMSVGRDVRRSLRRWTREEGASSRVQGGSSRAGGIRAAVQNNGVLVRNTFAN